MTIRERLRRLFKAKGLVSDAQIALVCGMSRSGTTLLTTVLDSHPSIVCGAELMPPALTSGEIQRFRDALGVISGEGQDDLFAVASWLKDHGNNDLAMLATRAKRAGVSLAEAIEGMEVLAASCPDGLVDIESRLLYAAELMRRRMARESATCMGFKYTSNSLELAMRCFPNACLVCIVRDPMDVLLSHQKRGFDKTAEQVCGSWNKCSQGYLEFAQKHPDRVVCVRYEDLVRAPRRSLVRIFRILPVDMSDEVLEFYKSESPIHSGKHPNAERLRVNFSADSIGVGRKMLSADDRELVNSVCLGMQERLGYDNPQLVRVKAPGNAPQVQLSQAVRAEMREKFGRKRKFTKGDYERILEPYLAEFEIKTMIEYVRTDEVGDRKILFIRHDVDHDIETALKIASWERDHGIRSTYCLLPTAWYYGTLKGRAYRHSDLLIDAIRDLVDLGHEINIHNNFVVIALKTGVPPGELLESELEFYDQLGVPITGTSTHGDALCREHGFRNWEMFEECCDDRFGGPRTIRVNGNGVRLGSLRMADFGLEYEAYDVGKDVYLTESGGNMRRRENTRARRPFGRTDSARGQVHGLLTHPVWWDFG